jgi:hypothetical protein
VRRELRIVLRLALFAALAWFAVATLRPQWASIRHTVSSLRPSWTTLSLASAAILVGYAILITAWRQLMAGWGSPIPWMAALRIWFVSNLGKYIPGKVWAIGAMAVLAREAGASPAVATGASIVMNLVNIAAGGIAIAVLGAGDVLARVPGARVGAWVVLGGTAVGLAAGPRLLVMASGWLRRLRGGEMAPLPTMSHLALLGVLLVNVGGWLAYGVGFWLFSRAITASGAGSLAAASAVYVASYLAGYLALFAPGGIGVREAAMYSLLITLQLATPADAAVLVASSRIWITVLEVVPGLLFLPGMAFGRRTSLPRSHGPTG